MNIMIFDTETTSLDKPFCYNIGYVIADTDTDEIIVKKNFVVEQVWHNPMLFTTAYYANKRNIYIAEMRTRKTKMLKYGYICQEMIRDIKNFNIELAFAYNSPFDEKVFNFNCDWFRCNNPFDNVEIKDIRGFAHQFLIGSSFIQFCDDNNLYTDNGNYSTTAETMYKYITGNIDFVEEHTALSDSIIEYAILNECLKNGADITANYQPKRSIQRIIEKQLKITDNKNNVLFETTCNGYTVYKSKDTIKIK